MAKNEPIIGIMETNGRGFKIGEFEDLYRGKCVLQKSSLATQDAIWFGIRGPKVTAHDINNPGKYVELYVPENVTIHSEMHLSQDMVRDILPYLHHFAETGDLPSDVSVPEDLSEHIADPFDFMKLEIARAADKELLKWLDDYDKNNSK